MADLNHILREGTKGVNIKFVCLAERDERPQVCFVLNQVGGTNGIEARLERKGDHKDKCEQELMARDKKGWVGEKKRLTNGMGKSARLSKQEDILF